MLFSTLEAMSLAHLLDIRFVRAFHDISLDFDFGLIRINSKLLSFLRLLSNVLPAQALDTVQFGGRRGCPDEEEKSHYPVQFKRSKVFILGVAKIFDIL